MMKKKTLMSGILLIVLILVWAVLSIASVAEGGAPAPTWFEHVDLMQLIIGGLFMCVLWFMIRTLRKIDANQALLFKKIDDLCAEFYELRGEHNAMKNRNCR